MVSKPDAFVLDIQRMSTEDGPGIRTTVFFKGCSLKCAWCHNPESISRNFQVQWIDSRCLGCRTCVDLCPSNALALGSAGVTIDRSACIGCGTCAQNCPTTAMESLGRKWSLDELTHEVLKDRAYFDKSGGGITVSGGEPCLQADFVGAFLKSLGEKGIHTALDTCGLCQVKALEQVLPHASMVLFDIKEIDPQRHKRFTGHVNDTILANLLHVAEDMRKRSGQGLLWIRTPVIPGMTDSEDTITGIGRFISNHLEDVMARWELCAFNNLCRDKYLRLGGEWIFKDALLIEQTVMERLTRAARTVVSNPERVLWTGATRLDESS